MELGNGKLLHNVFLDELKSILRIDIMAVFEVYGKGWRRKCKRQKNYD
jgi:hypothetical protein